jgi:hypothetical protein
VIYTQAARSTASRRSSRSKCNLSETQTDAVPHNDHWLCFCFYCRRCTGSHTPLLLPVRHRKALFILYRSSRSLVRLTLMFRFSLLTIRREARRRRTSIRGRRMLMSSKAPWYRRSMMARLKRQYGADVDRAAARSSHDLEERELNGTGETTGLHDRAARRTTDDLPALARVF